MAAFLKGLVPLWTTPEQARAFCTGNFEKEKKERKRHPKKASLSGRGEGGSELFHKRDAN